MNTEGGVVSGFAKASAIVERGNGQYILAEVRNVKSKTLTVKLFGSFFTTTGLADVASSTIIQKAAG